MNDNYMLCMIESYGNENIIVADFKYELQSGIQNQTNN